MVAAFSFLSGHEAALEAALSSGGTFRPEMDEKSANNHAC